MVIDRLKLAGAFKIFALLSYLIYFYMHNSNLFQYIPSDKDGYGFRKELIDNKCLHLLGGSNVVYGLSAEILSKNFCEASNLGINAEFGGFYNYVKWLGYDVGAKNIIYSSSVFYGYSLTDAEYDSVEIPYISLFASLKNLLINPRSKYGGSGDLINYNCKSHVQSYKINVDKFLESNNIIAKEIYKRILVIKKIKKTEDIFIRIPPIYVDNKKDADLYINLITKRIEILKQYNIKIVGDTVVSMDKSLFCDSFHPNAKGRKEFTKEIKFL